MLLDGKVVLVTGGAGGRVGPGISRALARHGAAVAINCFTSVDKAHALAKSFTDQGWPAKVWQCDCKDTVAVQAMMADIVATFGRIDGVVNNATSVGRGNNKEDWEPTNWDSYIDCYESEVKMALNTIYAARPYMQKQGGGRIVNIASEQWIRGADGVSPYVSSLAGRIGMSRRLVSLLGADNITINIVSPEATRDTEPIVKPLEARTGYERSIPLQRIATAEEIGDACAFFISDLAKFVSGAFLPVGGGRHPRMGG
jgi:3-oxoacyl-[acyl-carrier protein] reductase